MFSKQVVTDHKCEKWVHMSSWKPNTVREMLTHLGTPLYITDNSCMHHVAKCVGNHNIL